ncbi:MAG: hypothetical protein KBD31_05785 [Proteobacteria bacterium]|nr:hypothetical protein [Pseudomonadota bacterium]
MVKFLIFLLTLSLSHAKENIKKNPPSEIESLKIEEEDDEKKEGYNPIYFKKVRLQLLKKTTHHITSLAFTQKTKEHILDDLKIICKGAFIEKISPHFKGYWAFVEIFQKKTKQDDYQLIFSNWVNDKTVSFEHPIWILKLVDCEEKG